jgi:hypothetical protein
MRSRTKRSSVSEISKTLHRFGRNRRLVWRLEWLTLWPTLWPTLGPWLSFRSAPQLWRFHRAVGRLAFTNRTRPADCNDRSRGWIAAGSELGAHQPLHHAQRQCRGQNHWAGSPSGLLRRHRTDLPLTSDFPSGNDVSVVAHRGHARRPRRSSAAIPAFAAVRLMAIFGK